MGRKQSKQQRSPKRKQKSSNKKKKGNKSIQLSVETSNTMSTPKAGNAIHDNIINEDNNHDNRSVVASALTTLASPSSSIQKTKSNSLQTSNVIDIPNDGNFPSPKVENEVTGSTVNETIIQSENRDDEDSVAAIAVNSPSSIASSNLNYNDPSERETSEVAPTPHQGPSNSQSRTPAGNIPTEQLYRMMLDMQQKMDRGMSHQSQQISQLQQENSHQALQISQLQQENSHQAQQISRLTGDNSDLQEQIDQLKEEAIARIQKIQQLKKNEKEHAKLKKTLHDLRLEVAQLKKELERRKDVTTASEIIDALSLLIVPSCER